MKHLRFHFIFILACFACLPWLTSCDKNDDTLYNGVEFTGTGSLTLQLSHFFGSKPLTYAPDSFFSASGDTIKITKLAYYLSNITLENEAGVKSNFNTYHLIDEGVASTKTITLLNVPAGKYKSVSFMLGVDSVRNHSGAQDGDLDPAYGMFWTWNTGYVFYRLKGRFGKSNQAISYDVGGDKHTSIFQFPFTGAQIKTSKLQLQFKADIAEFFTGPNTINLRTDVHDLHSGTDTVILPRLYQNMQDLFTLTNIQ